MIVCICNALTSSCVRTAIDEGAKTPDEVYEACGTMRRCGSCASDIEDRIGSATLPVIPPRLAADTVLARAS